jgi:hypothetical protein
VAVDVGPVKRSELSGSLATVAADETGPPVSIRGQLLRLGEHREVAIYLRGDSTWIADFVDGHGVLVDVYTWFRFNCGTLANRHVKRRIALESAIPLSSELVARIQALHRDLERRASPPVPGAGTSLGHPALQPATGEPT